ncbi:Hypothetical predicted protein [Pelobates cultripes]|uniref:Uncharacterized protein n=1 Tax=Pelobates cultripes TaxID=61616 RepID=A0AAD1VWG5_PELCU|nr:Hypothetical predicted protein [Pelobates cultripes]
MCAEVDVNDCSLNEPTALSEASEQRLRGSEKSASSIPYKATHQESPYLSHQRVKQMANRDGDTAEPSTAAALVGRNTAKRQPPPGTYDYAAKQGTLTAGPTTYPPYT